MVAKCANPHCNAQFRYLKQGKLFLGEHIPAMREAGANTNRRGGSLQHYWLCDICSRYLTILRDGQQVQVVPLQSVTSHLRECVSGPSSQRMS